MSNYFSFDMLGSSWEENLLNRLKVSPVSSSVSKQHVIQASYKAEEKANMSKWGSEGKKEQPWSNGRHDGHDAIQLTEAH